MVNTIQCKHCKCWFETNNHRMRYCTYDCKEKYQNLKYIERWVNAKPVDESKRSRFARKNQLKRSIKPPDNLEPK